ncbi:7-carboxy-7-deazaguanine synthase [Maribrevibacterium harenarium]|uniref:7-carboxy-7-deazaguanine synthase n=1 Tax=Maribrevibacterium harenarium TaxID=2589817 RepID=A0A501X571_9GAMM|nr:7-carboxy-7-deazaguanine synthase [Maribrevibacterium harenarium]TPE55690.1 7-carboxy-7-deazaguanine synthase [Maribrevibacterium harenarium]
MYTVKEAFYSLQGEGAHAGRPAIFCRFTGCNLWSGKEKHRSSAQCQFCDTDFIGTDGQNGGRFDTAEDLIAHLNTLWPTNAAHKYLIFTGGEPALQLDEALIACAKEHDYTIAIETNGTLLLPDGIDWICVSPKTAAPLMVTQGNELKLVYPQAHLPPELFTGLEFDHFYLQPMDQSALPDGYILVNDSQQATISYCLAHPQWRLSLQTHKMLGID